MREHIPPFLKGSEFEALIQNEIDYKTNLKHALDDFRNEFNIDSKYIYLLNLFASLLRIEISNTDSVSTVSSKIKAVLTALREIGTFESVLTLFRIFLVVEADILLEQKTPGEVVIKLRSRPKFKRNIVLTSHSSKLCILIKKNSRKYIMGLNQIDFYYIENFYEFVKALMPAGIRVSIQEADLQKEII